MKNKKLLVLVIILALFLSSKTYAQDICSKSGYTVLTINGIFTDKEGAILNKNALRYKLSPTYNNQPILVDYVYNATHFGGAFDLADAVRQGLFDSGLDYDLVEMLDSASDKVTTQKILLVGHSQGNFYANSFYNEVTDKVGGVPSQSIGVYAVATPDDHVAGGGKYLTSDTDSIIVAIVGRLKNIMKPNTHIALQKVDGAGHDFSNIYLKYRSSQIVSDIKSSFDNLETNTIQNENIACISPQKVSILHDFTGVLLAATDFVVSTGVKVATLHFNITNKATNSFVNTLVKIAKSGLAAVGFADNKKNAPIIVASVPALVVEVDEPIVIAVNPPAKKIIDNIKINNPIITEKVEDVFVPDNIIRESSHSHNNLNKNEEVIIPEIIVPKIATQEIIIPEIIVPGVATQEIIIPEVIVPKIATSEVIDDEEDDKVDKIPPVITITGESTIYMTRKVAYVESGATAFDNIDGKVDVVTIGTIKMNINNIQTILYTATDKAGNISTAERIVKVSDLVYIPKYAFGTGNGDGHDWQAWIFNGSVAYNWTDTYVNGYLREQFKIETYGVAGAWSYGFVRGIFKSDPQKGFNASDLSYNTLEGNPQNNPFRIIYNITIQWDSKGYTVTIFHGATLDSISRVDLPNMNNDLWIGWTDNMNQFRNFPSTGSWIGRNPSTPGLLGGMYMMLTPFPVYDANADNTIPAAFPSWSSEKSITSFSVNVLSTKVDGVIDNTNHTVSLTVPKGTDVTTLVPTITISDDKAKISPLSYHVATDFTNPVSYIVKAEDKTTETYVVTVTEEYVIPDVIDFNVNGSKNNLTLNPALNHPTISLVANKNVNWLTIRIEKTDSVYKTLQSNSDTCVDGNINCEKIWEGDLSKGGLLQNGEYRIRVRIKDAEGTKDATIIEYEEYLPIILTVEGGV